MSAEYLALAVKMPIPAGKNTRPLGYEELQSLSMAGVLALSTGLIVLVNLDGADPA